jgi:hypothetical protein
MASSLTPSVVTRIALITQHIHEMADMLKEIAADANLQPEAERTCEVGAICEQAESQIKAAILTLTDAVDTAADPVLDAKTMARFYRSMLTSMKTNIDNEVSREKRRGMRDLLDNWQFQIDYLISDAIVPVESVKE